MAGAYPKSKKTGNPGARLCCVSNIFPIGETDTWKSEAFLAYAKTDVFAVQVKHASPCRRQEKKRIEVSSKGFIKILEAIIASIILLTSLSFFFSISLKETEWEGSLLSLRAEDVLYVLAKNGSLATHVQNNDVDSINSALSGLLPATIDYSIRIEGMPDPVISIGCLCTSQEEATLRNMLAPLDFQYKERNISIRTQLTNMTSIRNETDVLFTFNYFNFSAAKADADKFLTSGGAIIVFSDLSQGQVNDGYMNGTFGLVWNASNPGYTSQGPLDGVDDENRTAFAISKYYTNISGPPSGNFNFNGGIARIDTDERTVVINTNARYSLVKSNTEAVGGKGRTLWIVPYDTAQNNNNAQKLKNLTKAAVMWAASESFTMDKITKTPLRQNLKTSVIVAGRTGNGIITDSYKATLTVWRIFQ